MRALVIVVAGCLLADARAEDARPIKTLIITGHNNHNWEYTSRVHKDTLDATGLFQVEITDDPASALADTAKVVNYDLFVLDYNDAKRWDPDGPAEFNFLEMVRRGAGVVAIHAADNAFEGWKDYQRMLGLVYLNAPEGSSHGSFRSLILQTTDREHPITKGLADFAGHRDELYRGLINPQNTAVHVLMTGKEEESGTAEPVAFTTQFGKGRVFSTTLGHVWKDDPKTKRSVIDPQFRALLVRGAQWAATGSVTLGAEWKDTRPHNVLNEDESKGGWKLLFDGGEASAKANFREYRKDEFPTKGWSVHDGAIVHAAGGEGGDLVTMSQYDDFEFACQWKIATGGNSGIIYHATEDHGAPWETGPEMQILDDEVHGDKAKARTRAGAMYDLFGVSADTCRPAGEWNTAKLRIQGTHHQYWLNGVKVIDVDTTSQAYKTALAESKWTHYPDFNTRPKGHIDLQNHGDEVWFRDLRVRDLK
jgi:type 1 glutamine amidotransferase